MGHSRTYNLIGYGPEHDGKRFMYCAITALDVHQETVKAIRRGELKTGERIEWTAQTKRGERMLEKYPNGIIPPMRGVVMCPKCSGRGCGICNNSGETTRRWLRGFRAWQLESEVK